MTNNTKLDEKLEGAKKFITWKYQIMLILKENDLEGFIKEEVVELEGDEAKAKHNKDMIKVKIIIANSIKDNFISQVYSWRTPKEMFDSLSNLFEGRNINKKMTLRNQLKGVKDQKSETMHLEAIRDMIKDAEVVMTTLNGLPRY